MLSPHFPTLLLGLCILAFSPGLPGAEFRALSWDTPLTQVIYPGRSTTNPHTINASALGDWHPLTTNAGELEFKTLAPRPPLASAADKNPETRPPTLLAKVIWPEGLQRALLLFVPAPAGAATPYVIVVLPERPADAAPAALRVFNHSDRELALRLGTQSPAPIASLGNLDSDERPVSGILPLQLAYREESRWRLVADTSLALPPGFAAYVFVRNLPRFELEPNNPQIGHKLIYDRLPAPRAP